MGVFLLLYFLSWDGNSLFSVPANYQACRAQMVQQQQQQQIVDEKKRRLNMPQNYFNMEQRGEKWAKNTFFSATAKSASLLPSR